MEFFLTVIVFLSILSAWRWTWKKTKIFLSRKTWKKPINIFFSATFSLINSFSVFCIVGGLLFKQESDPSLSVSIFGLILATVTSIVLLKLTRHKHKEKEEDKYPKKNNNLYKIIPENYSNMEPISINEKSLDEFNRYNRDRLTNRFEKEKIKITNSSVKLPVTLNFSYIDSSGEITKRTVVVQSISSNSTHEYLEGKCLTRKASRTFRVDRIIGNIVDESTGEILSKEDLLSSSKKRKKMTFGQKKTSY